ncbi:hypothetical protein RJ639_016940 [Escallonia herrerae]|uniref:Rab interacting lysosomal protein dimerization domain-containing protein n=1 Tax=Escallonia herrerae TaxID=1293975 RepID=A0AA88VBA2_9ASTE|nr:hypothetical protein RJ639_016940 [Escallonia herrerae]
MPVTIRWEDEFWHMAEHGEGFERCDRGCQSKHEEQARDSRLAVLQRKVNPFAEELDDLIEERVPHFTKWEVQRRNNLKGQVMELQEELAACKRELTRATR